MPRKPGSPVGVTRGDPQRPALGPLPGSVQRLVLGPDLNDIGSGICWIFCRSASEKAHLVGRSSNAYSRRRAEARIRNPLSSHRSRLAVEMKHSSIKALQRGGQDTLYWMKKRQFCRTNKRRHPGP